MSVEKETEGVGKHLFYSHVEKGEAPSYGKKESGGLEEKKSPPTHKAIRLAENEDHPQVTVNSTEPTICTDDVEDHESERTSRQYSSGMIQVERPSHVPSLLPPQRPGAVRVSYESDDEEAGDIMATQSSSNISRMQQEISELREIMVGTAVVAQVVSPDEEDEEPNEENVRTKNKRAYTRWILIAVGILSLIAVIVVAVVVPMQASKERAASNSSTDLEDLLSSISSDGGKAMRTPSTPQYKALNWLTGNANLKSYTDEQKIQRYILATLYYSTDGKHWTKNDLWLDHGDECGRWLQEFGGTLDCTMDGSVRRLGLYSNGLIGCIPREVSWLSDSLSECLSSLW